MNKRIVLAIILLSLTSVFAGDYADGNIIVDGSDFANAILITDTEDLIKLSQTSTDWGKFFKQTADITFADSILQDWDNDGIAEGSGTSGFSSIGSQALPFSGSYDGGGYEIDKLYINGLNREYSALFGFVDSGNENDSVVIKNLVLGDGVKITSTTTLKRTKNYTAGFVGVANNKIIIDSCINYGSISSVNNVSISNTSSAGFIGRSEGEVKVTNSYNYGLIASKTLYEASYIAGFIGYAIHKITAENCHNYGLIEVYTGSFIGTSMIGGLFGRIDGSVTLNNCSNNNDINVVAKREVNVGGVAGSVAHYEEEESLNLYKCFNLGNILASSVSSYELFVGGLIGVTAYTNSHISDSYNKGDLEVGVRAEGLVGGLFGKVLGTTLSMSNCYNEGGIVSTGLAGGLICIVYSSTANISDSYNISRELNALSAGGIICSFRISVINIEKTYNKSSVVARSQTAGGFVSDGNGELTIKNSYNSGVVLNMDEGSTAGILGSFSVGDCSIINSYNNASVVSVNSNTTVGGLVGYSKANMNIINSYSSSINSLKEDDDKRNGLVGYFSSYNKGDVDNSYKLNISSSFFDFETSNVNHIIPSQSDFKNIGITTSKFKQFSNYDESWFSNIANDDSPWVYDSVGRPYLYWQDVAISNSSIVLGNEIDGDTIFVNMININEDFTVVEEGLVSCGYEDSSFNLESSCVYNLIINNVSYLNLDSNKYYIAPYLKLSNGSYYYGDMVGYNSPVTKEVKINVVSAKKTQIFSLNEIEIENDTLKFNFDISFMLSVNDEGVLSDVVFHGTEGVCEIGEDGVSLNIINIGECGVWVTKNGDSEYDSAFDFQHFTIVKNTQEIYLADSTKLNVDLSDTTVIKLEAFTKSGMEVNFKTSNGLACNLNSDGVVTLKDIGKCYVRTYVEGSEQFYEKEVDFVINITNSENPDQLLVEELNVSYFSQRLVKAYTLKGEFIKSKYCATIIDYREFVKNIILDNDEFVIQ